MALMQRALPLPVHAPIPPDHVLCHYHTGAQRLNPLDCQIAIDTEWPSTNTYLTYYLDDPHPSEAPVVPQYSYLGSCRVALETAGPTEHLPHSMLLRPSELRGLAGYLIQQCAVERNGIGGFVTLGFTSALSWVHEARNLSFAGNFLTISIEPRGHLGTQVVEPGSRDANIPARLAAHMAGLGIALGNFGKRLPYDLIAKSLHNRALEMSGSYKSNLTWWTEDGHFSWWAQESRQRDNSSTTDMLKDTSKIYTSVRGNIRQNVSTALDESAGSVESEKLGAASGNSTRPSHPGDGSGDSGEDGDDEQSSAGRIDDTLQEIIPEIGEANDEDMAEEDDEMSEKMENLGLGLDVGDMTYQCDDSLGGGPKPVDCEKLSWSGLKPPDSVETLQANVPQFYTQGTCGFAISSVAPTTILWSHLLTAFETLNMFCVQNPVSVVKGGRAYYGQQRVSSWINGKARKKRDSTRVDATEALPRGINATIFRHDAQSNASCEWVLAEEGKNLTGCRGD